MDEDAETGLIQAGSGAHKADLRASCSGYPTIAREVLMTGAHARIRLDEFDAPNSASN
jgi:hypothetical protein